MVTTKQSETITVAAASRRLGVSSWTLYRRIRENSFYPAVHIGKTVRVSVEMLNEYIRSGGQR
jgi:excisionase family DNA binding protein